MFLFAFSISFSSLENHVMHPGCDDDEDQCSNIKGVLLNRSI